MTTIKTDELVAYWEAVGRERGAVGTGTGRSRRRSAARSRENWVARAAQIYVLDRERERELMPRIERIGALQVLARRPAGHRDVDDWRDGHNQNTTSSRVPACVTRAASTMRAGSRARLRCVSSMEIIPPWASPPDVPASRGALGWSPDSKPDAPAWQREAVAAAPSARTRAPWPVDPVRTPQAGALVPPAAV